MEKIWQKAWPSIQQPHMPQFFPPQTEPIKCWFPHWVGFLTGGRGQKFRTLPEDARRTQEEEAYARATVALTRARKMCVIFCPLDMKGLLGAATVMGSLMYGVGHCWNGAVNMHLRSPSLEDCPDGEEFLSN